MIHNRSSKLSSVIVMFLLATLLAFCPFLSTAGAQQGAPYGGGDTFPGADVPFGMVQWSPDTVNYVPGGYWYNDNRLRGFSLTHLNGAGCGVYSDIPFMPYVGTVTRSPATYPMLYISTFSHANESAAAGYYQVKLNNGVNTELTATQRSGAGRFTYPQGKTATMLVNVSGSINGVNDAQANIGGDTISGWATSGGFCGASDVYRVYFWAQFGHPFPTVGTWHNNIVTPGNTNVQGSSQTAPAVRQVEIALSSPSIQAKTPLSPSRSGSPSSASPMPRPTSTRKTHITTSTWFIRRPRKRGIPGWARSRPAAVPRANLRPSIRQCTTRCSSRMFSRMSMASTSALMETFIPWHQAMPSTPTSLAGISTVLRRSCSPCSLQVRPATLPNRCSTIMLRVVCCQSGLSRTLRPT